VFENLKSWKLVGFANSKPYKSQAVGKIGEFENSKTCRLANLEFFKLFSGFEKLKIIKLENLVAW